MLSALRSLRGQVGAVRRCPAPAGCCQCELGFWFGSSLHVVLTAAVEEQSRLCSPGGSAQHHQALSSAASVCPGLGGCPTFPQTVYNQSSFGEFLFIPERSDLQSVKLIYQEPESVRKHPPPAQGPRRALRSGCWLRTLPS